MILSIFGKNFHSIVFNSTLFVSKRRLYTQFFQFVLWSLKLKFFCFLIFFKFVCFFRSNKETIFHVTFLYAKLSNRYCCVATKETQKFSYKQFLVFVTYLFKFKISFLLRWGEGNIEYPSLSICNLSNPSNPNLFRTEPNLLSIKETESRIKSSTLGLLPDKITSHLFTLLFVTSFLTISQKKKRLWNEDL